LYAKVFEQTHENCMKYGNISWIPAKDNFNGMDFIEEVLIE
jgi:pyruvate carboxylase